MLRLFIAREVATDLFGNALGSGPVLIYAPKSENTWA